jgi:hypothetical protein
LSFFYILGLHFPYILGLFSHIFWAYFTLQTTHQKFETKIKTYYNQNQNQNQNQNILQTKTKTYYTESLKPKPKSPKHTINLQTTESLKPTNANKTDIISLQHMAQNP